ncbi:FUSC family protein [Streptomyces sp. RPT161]|uniref:FUSC family protein n=1 Tax=Streptomyces sp. RPT161 TaxID=3015993 RepID=UPI0022B8859C|nr:aromatic acid exporter family protein [Streptomyces sp. RPT161]
MVLRLFLHRFTPVAYAYGVRAAPGGDSCKVPAVPTPLVGLIRLRNEPVVVQMLRSTAAAVISYIAAVRLSNNPSPLTAPLTALLVVQVTLYTTLTTGIRRVGSVVAGVLIAVAFSALFGLTWWSLGLIILASLLIGHLIRVDEFVAEVAISGMLILGVSTPQSEALDRVLETVIGAVIGVLLNLLVAPPVFVQPAGEAVAELAERIRQFLLRIAAELGAGATSEQTIAWLHDARRLDNDIARFDEFLRRAEESTRLNPRVRQGAMARLILRSGLDTLEVCVVVLRTLCRSLSDLSMERSQQESVYEDELSAELDHLLTHIADAVHSFGQLISAQVTAGAERAEAELEQALHDAREDRDHIAALLRAEAQQHWERWQLHGALIASIDRLLDELDVEKRSQWLASQLARTVPAESALGHRLRRGARTTRGRLRRPFKR